MKRFFVQLSPIVALGALLAAPAARAGRDRSPESVWEAMEEAREAAERSDPLREGRGEPELDDPGARYRAQREVQEGRTSDAALLQHLRAARRERDRVGQVERQAAPRAGSVSAFSLQSGPSVQGNAWINVGPDNADMAQDGAGPVDSGRISSIVPHPDNPDILYLASAGGGIWKTWDRGATWVPLTDRLGTLGSGALAMDPSNPDVLAYGFGDAFDLDLMASGITLTTDGGLTWSDPQPQTVSVGGIVSVARQVRDLKFDPLDSSHLLAATDIGLFRSTDFGATWQLAPLPDGMWAWSIGYLGSGTCGTGRCSNWLAALEQAATPQSGSPLGNGGLTLFRSSDGGATWTPAQLPRGESDAAGRATIAVAPSTTGDATLSRVYVLAGATLQLGLSTRDVYRSDDGGYTFRGLGVNAAHKPANPNDDMPNLDVLSGQSWYNQAIIVSPVDPDVVLVGGQLAMIRTTDAGRSWTVISDWMPVYNGFALPYSHPDFHAMAASAFPATSPGGPPQVRFFFGNDGGVFVSDNAHTAAPSQVSISSLLNRGIVSHLAYSVVCPRAEWPDSMQDFLMGGFQDIGTRRRSLTSTYGTGTFDLIYGGDGFGAGVTRAVQPGPAPAPSLIIATTFGGISYSPIHVSRDNGQNWTEMSNGLVTTNLPFRMFIVPEDTPDGDGETFLTYSSPKGAEPGHVFRITQASAIGAWSKIDGQIAYPDGTTGTFFKDAQGTLVQPRALGTHAKRAGIYAMSGSGGAVFSTTDAGAHWVASRPLGTSPQQQLQIKGANGLDFDWSDPSSQTLWVGSNSTTLYDAAGTQIPGSTVPDSYGHLFRTTDGGQTWQPLRGSGAHTLPNVTINVVKFDPNDARTVYIGASLGLYVTHDGGQTFDRMGVGLPLAAVKDLCITTSTGAMRVATYGRGFWEIDTHAAGVPAGTHGNGDLDFNQRLDPFDLVELVVAMGKTNADDGYRQQADLTGRSAAIDDADLTLLLSRIGGTP